MKKLDQTKLEELHNHIQTTPDIDRKGIAEYLGEDAEPWVAALKETYPESYDVADEPEPPKKKAGRPPAAVKEEATEYFIVENSIKIPLALMATKGNQVILERIEPKDEVIVKIRGVDVMIDLLKLEAESVRHNLPASQLKMLGELAKG